MASRAGSRFRASHSGDRVSMTQNGPNPARAGGAAGSWKHHKRLASEFPDFKLPDPPAQAQSRHGGRAQHLRLVPPAPPPRPRRLVEVRIAASDGRLPIGRTRPIRLSDRDVDLLVDYALRLEWRA